MRDDLVQVLCCPETGAPLEIAHVESAFTLGGTRHIVEGMLRGVSGPRFRYPILDEIPRVVPRDLLSEAEIAAALRLYDADDAEGYRASVVEPEIVDDAGLAAAIRARMEGLYRLSSVGDEHEEDAAARRRSEGEITYMRAEASGANKRKYLPLVTRRLDGASSILELGGNFPGLTRLLAERFRPRQSVVANLQILFPQAYKTADRSVQAVRADAQSLPFRDDSFELVASAFMLEHVPDWRAAQEEMLRVGAHVFLAFGPNKHFPFEVGHIDAPLAGTLPAPWDAYVAWAWLAAIGRRRPFHRVREILGEVFHVSSRAFERRGRRLGARLENLFPELVDTLVADRDAPPTPTRRLARRAPGLARTVARALTAVRLEPQIYYWLEPPGRD
ncbi:MAG: methyltransferase domain-containing protein [Acidobacteriota bacterium]